MDSGIDRTFATSSSAGVICQGGLPLITESLSVLFPYPGDLGSAAATAVIGERALRHQRNCHHPQHRILGSGDVLHDWTSSLAQNAAATPSPALVQHRRDSPISFIHVYITAWQPDRYLAHLSILNRKTPSDSVKLQFTATSVSLLALIFILLNMAFQMPTFLSRFLRPLTTSASMSLQPDALAAMEFPTNTQRAIFAGGCFWGVEELYRKHWGGGKGLLDCRVGYIGGSTKAPTYREVCSKDTGHAESLLIVFDPERVTYRQLVEFFFKMHDPTTLNRQGADTGTQYRSAIFVENDDQMKIAQEIKEKVGDQWYKGKTITTQIQRATQWYDAEDYHQDYLDKMEKAGEYGYHCPAHYVRPHPELK